MTEAAQAPFKGPFEVEPHYWEEAETKISGYEVRDTEGKLVVLFHGYGTEPKAQWLRDHLNAATRPAAAAGSGEAPCPVCDGDGWSGTYFSDGSKQPCGECGGTGLLPRLYAALWPFLEVVAWAKRNGCDLASDVDMLQRTIRDGIGDKFGGHLGVQGCDFIALAAAWQAARATAPAGHVLTAEEQDHVDEVRQYLQHDGTWVCQRLGDLLAIISRLTSTEPK